MGIAFGPMAIYRYSSHVTYFVEKDHKPFAMVSRSIAAMSQATEATIAADDAAEWSVSFMTVDSGLNRSGLTLAQAKAYVGNISDAQDEGARRG